MTALNMLKLTARTDQPHFELPPPQVIGEEFSVCPVGDESVRVFSGGKQIAEIPAHYSADFEVKHVHWWEFWRRGPYWAHIPARAMKESN